jgi:flavodoxin I
MELMKTLVVFDTVWGNTEKIARAIGAALEPRGEVKVVAAGAAKPTDFGEKDLIIVGSATQKFTSLPAVKKLLAGLPAGALKGAKVAAFDTRLPVDEAKSRALKFMAKNFGYAAEKLDKTLVKKGGVQTAPPVGFFVGGTEGPIKDGELGRAAAWAKGL